MTLDYVELPCSLNEYCYNFPLPFAYGPLLLRRLSSVEYSPSSVVCGRLATAAVAATVWHFVESSYIVESIVCSLPCLLHLADAVLCLSAACSRTILFNYLAHLCITRSHGETETHMVKSYSVASAVKNSLKLSIV